MPESEDPLRDLRERLDRARAAAADEQLVTGPAEAGALVGMTRARIVRDLGPAGRCTMMRTTECANGEPCREVERAGPAPCRSTNDRYYSFYHLPEGWNGGGPELLLQFDEGGTCTSADWFFTQ